MPESSFKPSALGPSMRCHWSIVYLLLLISLGSELCLMPGGVVPKDQPHSAYVVGDDVCDEAPDSDHGRDLPDFDSWSVTPLHAAFLQVRTDMILSHKSVEALRLLSSGIRRHRRFCVERC